MTDSDPKRTISSKKSLISEILESGAEIYSISFENILFDAYVQMKCQNCPTYGSNHHCPPYTPRYYQSQSMLRDFKRHYIVLIRENRTNWMKQISLKYPKYGYTQLLNITSRNWNTTSYWKQLDLMLKIKDYLFSNSSRKSLVLGGGGSCKRCRTCSVFEGKGCKKPEKSLASPESWGIDVYGTLINLGIPLEIPPRHVYTRVGFIGSDTTLPTETISHVKLIRKKKEVHNTTENLNDFLKLLRNEPCVSKVIAESTNDIPLDFSVCTTCTSNTIFLCDRTFLPTSDVATFLKTCILISIWTEKQKGLARHLAKWSDIAHRSGFFDALTFSNYPCDICELCTIDGCGKSTKKNPKQHGRKEAFRCIGYIGLFNHIQCQSNERTPDAYILLSSTLQDS